MRDARDVLEYLDSLVAYWVDRPEMYAPDPSTLEYQFMLIEDIRAFVLHEGDAARSSLDNGYIRFLMAEGLGAATFTTTRESLPVEAPTRDRFAPLCDFLRRYLASEYRRLWKSDDSGDNPGNNSGRDNSGGSRQNS
jgi:hypothetical protein